LNWKVTSLNILYETPNDAIHFFTFHPPQPLQMISPHFWLVTFLLTFFFIFLFIFFK
jgi:hypothetical protein